MIVAVAERSLGRRLAAKERQRLEEEWCLEEALSFPAEGSTWEGFELLFGFPPDKVVDLLPPCLEIEEWDSTAALTIMDELVTWAAEEGHQLIFLGQRVCDVFTWPESLDFGTRATESVSIDGYISPVEGLLLPYPSAQSQGLWADPAFVEQMRTAVDSFIE